MASCPIINNQADLASRGCSPVVELLKKANNSCVIDLNFYKAMRGFGQKKQNKCDRWGKNWTEKKKKTSQTRNSIDLYKNDQKGGKKRNWVSVKFRMQWTLLFKQHRSIKRDRKLAPSTPRINIDAIRKVIVDSMMNISHTAFDSRFSCLGTSDYKSYCQA